MKNGNSAFDASSLFGRKKQAQAPSQDATNTTDTEFMPGLPEQSKWLGDDSSTETVVESVTSESTESETAPVPDAAPESDSAVVDASEPDVVTSAPDVENAPEAAPVSPAFVAESQESFIDDQPEQKLDRPALLETADKEPSASSVSITESRTVAIDVSCSDLYGASGTKILKSLENENILYRVFGDKRCTSMRAVVVSPATFKVILEQLARKNVAIDIAEKTIPWFTDVAFSSLTNGKLFRDGTLVHAIARRDVRPALVASVLIQKSAPAVAYLLPANLYALACE